MKKRIANIRNDLDERITFEIRKDELGILVYTNSDKVKIKTKVINGEEIIEQVVFNKKPVLNVGDYITLKSKRHKIIDIYLLSLEDKVNSFYLETLKIS